MRDLKARLRAVVRQSVDSSAGSGGFGGGGPVHDGAVRELTYIPELAVPLSDLDRTAALLGGARYETAGSACVVIDRFFDDTASHGRRRVEAYRIAADAPIALFDPRVAGVPDWAGRVVFFDIETTGLSGGAGTLPLLAGCGWFER